MRFGRGWRVSAVVVMFPFLFSATLGLEAWARAAGASPWQLVAIQQPE